MALALRPGFSSRWWRSCSLWDQDLKYSDVKRLWIIALVIGICITLTGCGREGDRAPSEQKVTAPSPKSARVIVSPTTPYNPLENTETAVAGTPSLLAASNDRRVPGVVGRKASKACQILRRDGYGGGVFAVRGNDGLGRGRIVAQDPPSGSKGPRANWCTSSCPHHSTQKDFRATRTAWIARTSGSSSSLPTSFPASRARTPPPPC